MRPDRPATLIQHDLDTARAAADRLRDQPITDHWSLRMRDDNERDVTALERELTDALSSDLQLSLDGTVVEDHRVALPYLNRTLSALQSTYRAVVTSLSDDRLRRDQTTLALSGTAPGSFVLQIKVPPEQLQLTEEPLSDRGMGTIVGLLGEAGEPDATPVTDWASRAEEAEVRSMIRLAAALAASRGTTRVRWRSVAGSERSFSVSTAQARALAVSLAGETGREVQNVTGHLQMAQDQPPRVRVVTEHADFVAAVRDEDMLDTVKDLLFTEVDATIVVDMRTSPTTGEPGVKTELVDIQPAAAVTAGDLVEPPGPPPA